MGLMPGSDEGRAAEYSAWVCRSLTFSALATTGMGVELGEVLVRCVAMAREWTSQVEPARRGDNVPTKTPIVPAVTKSRQNGVIFEL